MKTVAVAVAGWTIWAVTVILACGGAATRPGGIVLGLPPLALVLALVAVTALLARVCGLLAGKVLVGLLPAAVALVVIAPSVEWLRALSGPPLFALAAAGLVLVFPAGVLPHLRRAFFPAVLLLCLVMAARVQSHVGPEGDEPHYLVVADSLLHDHDLAVEQDFREGRYRSFHPGPLEPHYRRRGRNDVIYSLHAIGLSVLVLPAYAAGGYPGASFFMALLAALLAREIRELVAVVMEDRDLADAVGWMVALSPPLLPYAGLIFTEVPAALLITVVLRRQAAVHAGARQAAALGLAIAVLPWLNVRYALLSGILMVVCLASRPARRNVIALALPVALSAGAIAVYHFILYGFFDPRLVYGNRPEFAWRVLPEGLPGLFLDQEFGLLVYAPAVALALPGLVALFRRAPRLAAGGLAMAGAVILVAGAWPMWRGGFNPPGRFLVPLLPLLALCCAAAVGRVRSAAVALLLGWGLWTGMAGVAEPRWVHRDRDGTAPLFRVQSGADEWTRLLPGFVLEESAADRARLAALWALVLVCAVMARRRTATASGLSVACAALIGAAGLASRLSSAPSTGREAVRVVGRPALELPEWRWTKAQEARWEAGRLPWAGLYEPHRHPDGAAVGERLPLRPGEYDLVLETRVGWPTGALPALVARSGERALPATGLHPGVGRLHAHLTVPAGVSEVSLLLRGGGPLAIDRVVLRGSTFDPAAGLSH